jgi:hypothetical protein
MHRRRLVLSVVAGMALSSGLALAAAPPTQWDGLTQVKSKRFAVAYVAPGVSFAQYHRVMIDPVEIAFQKNYVRDYNRDTRELGARIKDSDVERVVVDGSKRATMLFTKAFTDAGYQVVTAPAPDVVRVRSGVVDIYVNAPDIQSAGRRTSAAPEAGHATFVVEARDSVTGALLGRVLDKRFAGDDFTRIRSSVSNRGDFEQLFKGWAKKAVAGFGEIKQLPAPAGG